MKILFASLLKAPTSSSLLPTQITTELQGPSEFLLYVHQTVTRLIQVHLRTPDGTKLVEIVHLMVLSYFDIIGSYQLAHFLNELFVFDWLLTEAANLGEWFVFLLFLLFWHLGRELLGDVFGAVEKVAKRLSDETEMGLVDDAVKVEAGIATGGWALDVCTKLKATTTHHRLIRLQLLIHKSIQSLPKVPLLTPIIAFFMKIENLITTHNLIKFLQPTKWLLGKTSFSSLLTERANTLYSLWGWGWWFENDQGCVLLILLFAFALFLGTRGCVFSLILIITWIGQLLTVGLPWPSTISAPLFLLKFYNGIISGLVFITTAGIFWQKGSFFEVFSSWSVLLLWLYILLNIKYSIIIISTSFLSAIPICLLLQRPHYNVLHISPLQRKVELELLKVFVLLH